MSSPLYVKKTNNEAPILSDLDILLALIFSVIIAVVLIFTLKKSISIPTAGIIIIILTFIDLSTTGSSFNRNPENPLNKYELHPQLKNMLKPNPPKDIFRVAMRLYKPSYMAMQRNQGLMDEIMLIEGYNPLILERVKPPLNTKEEVLDLYSVKYEIAIDNTNRPYFKERKTYFPQAWLVYKAQIVKPEEIEKIMQTKKINYKKEAIIEENLSLKLDENPDTTGASIECLEYSNHYIKYKVKTNSNALLLLSEIWYPSWVAIIDDDFAEVYRADYCFRTVLVPRGEHIVELKFKSATVLTGFFFTIFTLLASIFGLILSISIGKKNIANK